MIPTPGTALRQYGLGAVNYVTGETVVLVRLHKRRTEVAELLQALLEKHPAGQIFVVLDNVNTHMDGKIEQILRANHGRLILLYLPTYSPWLNPIEMLWRHYRREVTHCEFFTTLSDLIQATLDFFERYNRYPQKTLSIIGSSYFALLP